MLSIVNKTKLICGAVLLIIAVVIYSFLWGRLFPFTPIIVGFEKCEFEKVIIYFHDNDDILDFEIIDSLIYKTEKFHQMSFNRKVEIFICHSEKEIRRLAGSGTRFNTHPVYGRIFISGKANNERKEGKIHLDIYLKHELSHSLLYQNMSLFSALTFPGWFMEGVAVYSANQMGFGGYYSKEQTVNKMKEGYFIEPEDWGTNISSQGKSVTECSLENKYWFIYSEFGFIIDDLIQTYGKTKFDRLLKESLSGEDFYDLFKRIYSKDFSEYMNGFKRKFLTIKKEINMKNGTRNEFT